MNIQEKTDSLTEAFDITKSDQVIAFVGAGGKTTLIDFLAQELAKKGFYVGIMTTTHRYYPQKFNAIEKKKEEILEILKREHIAEIGRIAQTQHPVKTGPVSREMYEWMKRQVDFLLVEADGAKRMPVKVPGMQEPVLYSDMKKVIVTAGLCAVGKKWKESCFRCNSYFSQTDSEKIVQADDIVYLMQSVYPKADGRTWMFFFNQWDCIRCEEQKERVKSAVAISRYPIRWGQLQKDSDKKIEVWGNR
ncbi:MAG: selenium cofactor biosynthesis protein YqeC [Eubacteriales bacterium]|nr:selenium cofactor biosynthesis protein YqeC [Eubacteriales bacterium]